MKKLNNKRSVEEKAIDACAAYLRSIGWEPLVAGFESIEQGGRKYNFRLVLGFTGKKKDESSPSPERKVKDK